MTDAGAGQREFVEWWTPEPGVRVRVRVSPECTRHHWSSPDTGVVYRVDEAEEPHRFYVMSAPEDWQKHCWAGYYAAQELEPVARPPDRGAVEGEDDDPESRVVGTKRRAASASPLLHATHQPEVHVLSRPHLWSSRRYRVDASHARS